MIEYEFEGMREFEAAIRRNPQVVKSKSRAFITSALALYRKSILRSPWGIGMQGGGSPVATGGLRDTHRTDISDFEGKITPTREYSPYVHEGTYKMQSRPYLEYAKESQDPQVKMLERDLLGEIIKDLSK